MLWKNNEDIDHYQVLLFTSKDNNGLVAEHFTGKSGLTRRLYHRRAVCAPPDQGPLQSWFTALTPVHPRLIMPPSGCR